MLAKDVMNTRIVTVGPDTSVRDIAETLLKNAISGAPVVDAAGAVVGMVSEGDFLRRAEIGTERRRSWWLSLLAGNDALARDYVKAHGLKARDIMTREVTSVGDDAPVAEIARLLEERRVKRLPVIRNGKLVGIVSRADILRVLASVKPSRPVPASASDQAIRDGFLKALAAARLALSPYVSFVVSEGVVHVWGAIGSEAEGDAIRVACESIPGVKSVEMHARPLVPAGIDP